MPVPNFIDNIRDDITCALGIVRTLRAAQPIARNHQRVFPDAVS